MDFMALLGPLLGIGSNLLGTMMGNTGEKSTNGISTTGAKTLTKDKQTTNLTGSTNTSQNQNVSQQGGSNTTQQTAQESLDQSNQTGQVSRLDNATKGLLTNQVQQLLAGAGTGASLINSRMAGLANNDFDTAGFVNGIMQSAQSTLGSELESGLGAITQQTGGTVGNNSASALLANKLKMQTDSNLAGIRSDATARAEEIRGARSSELAGLSAASGDSLSRLLAPLLQASETSQVAATGSNKTSGTSSSATTDFMTQLTNMLSTQNQNQKQTTKQASQSNVAQTTTASEDVKTKENDWEKFWGNLGKGFNASFNAFPAGT